MMLSLSRCSNTVMLRPNKVCISLCWFLITRFKVSQSRHKSPLLLPNQFFKVACADSTLLVVVFQRCQTLSVHAQTNFSFTLLRMVLSTYFNKSGYFPHTFRNCNTKLAYNSF